MSTAARLLALFNGLHRAYGIYRIVTTKDEGPKLVGNTSSIKTVRGEVNEELWTKHLEGSQGLGIIPIRDDNTVVFGAIDIDVYEGLDYAAISRKIKEFKLPLVPCRSKSGGVHCYMFTKEPVPAKLVQSKLTEFAAALGHGGVEIFPKQTEIIAEKGDVGQWINMPYFNEKETTRYGLTIDGSPMTCDAFLEYAEVMKIDLITLKGLRVISQDKLNDGPPCLQHLITIGFPPGTRNDGLFNIAVYLRKANPETWEKDIYEYNKLYLRPPLTPDEVEGVTKSAKRKEYLYTCSKPPIKPYCNSGLCRTRKHGIGILQGMPVITGLTKFDSRPPIWFADIEGGGRLELTTEDLQNQLRFQKSCMDALNSMPATMKPSIWNTMISALLEKVNIVEAPPEASPVGQLMLHLETFCTSRAQAKSKDELLLGKPFLEESRHYFRLNDFTQYLDRLHFRLFNPAQVASVLRDTGGEHKFFNLKGRGINCFSYPEFKRQTEVHEIPDYKDKDAF
jgi:hypothetical protein